MGSCNSKNVQTAVRVIERKDHAAEDNIKKPINIKIKKAPVSNFFRGGAQMNKASGGLFTSSTSRTEKIRRKFVKPKQAGEALSGTALNTKPTAAEHKQILKSLNQHFILKNIEDSLKEKLIKEMKPFSIKAGDLVFEQGSTGKQFYIVVKGSFSVIVNDEVKGKIIQGQSFGELALLDDTPRKATITALSNSVVWVLDRDTFRDAIKQLNEHEFSENLQFINSVSLFETMNSDQKERLANSLRPQSWSEGETIFRAGDLGDLFYIIKEGTVACIENHREVRQMGKGEYFGELALLFNVVRTATIMCLTNVKVASVGREKLIEVFGSNLEHVIYRNTIKIIIDKSPVLSVLSHEQEQEIVSKMDVLAYHDDEVVIQSGTPKNREVIFILKGNLKSFGKNYPCFSAVGDDCLTLPSTRAYSENIRAKGETHICKLSRSFLEELIGDSVSQMVSLNELMSVFGKIQLFRNLPQDKIKELLNHVETVTYREGEMIVEQDTIGDSFYIIKEGIVDVIKYGHIIRSLPKFDYFGERGVLFHDIRSASVISRGDTQCWVLSKDSFAKVIDEDIRKNIMKRIELQDDTVELNDLIPVSELGKGSFGHVYLAVHRQKHTFYSLKTIQRVKIDEYDMYDNVVQERNILLELDHPMIMKLVKTFKDNKRLYLLMEYVKGIDLFDALRAMSSLSEKDTKFYSACLVLIVEYLHSLNIVYRDLKPENVMVDEEGYLKLVDFGTAKKITGRTYTCIGTPHYMAPEVILGAGYIKDADWWSVGVIVYELMFKRLPFGHDEDDPHNVYEKVIEGNLVFPPDLDIMSSVRVFIQQLLSKNHNARNVGGSIKKSRWFSNFNWDGLITKKLKAHFLPQLDKFDDNVKKAFKGKVKIDEYINKAEGKIEVCMKGPRNWDQSF